VAHLGATETNLVGYKHLQRPYFCEEPHLYNLVSPQVTAKEKCVYLRHVLDNSIHHFALERLKDNSTITRDEFGLTTPTENNTLANIQNRDDGNDVTELTRTSAFNVGIELAF
jgi:hypothetical protein